MNLIEELENRLDKYKVTINQNQSKKELIGKEIQFLTEIKDRFFQVYEIAKEVHEIYGVFPDTLEIRGKIEKKYPDFSFEFWEVYKKNIDLFKTYDVLIQVHEDYNERKKYYNSKGETKKAKDMQKFMDNIVYSLNSIKTMAHHCMLFQETNNFNFQIKLLELLLKNG